MADSGFDLSSATPVEQGQGDFDLGSAQPAEFEDDSAVAPLPTRAEEIAGGVQKILDPRNSPTFGAVEAGLRFGTGSAAFLLKGLRSAWNLATEKPGHKVSEANKAMKATDDAMLYEPATPYGQLFGKVTDFGGGWPGMLADKAGMKVTEKTGSPGWGAATSFGLQAAPVILGAKYASRTGRVAPGLSDAGAEAAARNHVSNVFGLDFDQLSANVQKKLKALAATGSDLSSLDASAVARQSRLDQLGIPYTRGDVTRSGSQITREESLSKAEKAGAPIREVRAGQDEALHAALAKLRSGTGAMAETREGVGTSVQDLALRKKEAVSEANYRGLYDAARTTEPDATVSVQPMAELLKSSPELQHLGFMQTWLRKAGIVADEDGNLTGNTDLKLNELDDLRKKAVKIARNGGENAPAASDTISAIDQAFEGVPAAAKAWTAARNAFKAHKIEFEDTGAVQKQVGMKSRVDRTTALADTFDRFIGGSADDIRNIQKSLTTGGDVKTQAAGMQAWKDLQGATIDYLKEKAVGKRGIESDTSTAAGARAFESGKPLEQFNSGFRDAYSELKKDGKIDAIFSPAQVAELDKIYSAVGDVRTRPAARISGSPTAANAVALLEDMAHRHILESVPVVGKPLGWAANWYRARGKTNREMREAASTPLDEQAQKATDAARRARVMGRIFRFGAAPIVGGAEDGPQRPMPPFARGGVVGFSEGGVALKSAVKKLAESLEEIKARRTLEKTQAKAPHEGMFSTLDQLIQNAPNSVTTPEQWGGWLNPGRALTREGVSFPLKKDEMDFTGANKLLAMLKERQAPEKFQLSSETPVETPIQAALKNFHQELQAKGLGHYDTPEAMQQAWYADTPHPQTGHVLTYADTDMMDRHANIMQELKNGPEAAAADPFSDQNLGNMSKSGVSKNDLLSWLRTHRPAINSEPSTQYAEHVPGYLKNQDADGHYNPSIDYVADLTQIPEHWDPEVLNQMNRYGGHFSPRPLSWSRSARSTNLAGQTGRTIAEIQSDVHQKAGDKVATPAPELRAWLQDQMNNPVLPQAVRNELPGLSGMQEQELSLGEAPPEGMSVRPRGYGSLEAATSRTPGMIQPLYEGLPFKKLEGYAPMEMRKQLARSVNEGSDWLAMVAGGDQRQSGERATAMGKVYGTPEDLGIYPTMLQKLARQYNVPFDPAHQISIKPKERRPAATQPIELRAQTPYDADALRRAGRIKGNRTYGAGDHIRDQQKALKAQLEAAIPNGDLQAQIIANGGALRPAVRRFVDNTDQLAQDYTHDISQANDAGLVDWGVHREARDLRYGIKKLTGKMTDWRGKMPGPVALREKMNRLEALHNMVKPLIEAHNAQLGQAAELPPETINRPAMLLDPETRARIGRIGVPLFKLAGAGLGLEAMRNTDQQDQGFARGGIVQRFGEGGVALKSAVKKLAESLEEIKARRTLEQAQAKAPTEGQFSTLDKVIEGAPDDLNTPDVWQSYLTNPGRSFSREGVNFPLKDEELGFTGTRTLLQKLKERVQPPAVKIHPAHRELAALAASPENYKAASDVPLTKSGIALKDFRDWAEANRDALQLGNTPITTPLAMYQAAENIHPMPDWRRNANGQQWDAFYRHYTNVDRHGGNHDPIEPPLDPFSPDKLAAQGITPDKVTKNDLLAWLRANRPQVEGKTHAEHPTNRAPWLRDDRFPYREELSIINNHWDPEVTPSIRKYTGHYGRLPLSWSRSTDVLDPDGNMGRMINEIQSDFHGKAGNRVATPPAQLTEWANSVPEFVPPEVRKNILQSPAFKERELSTENDVPEGMGVRRIGYGPLSELEGGANAKAGRVPPIYEGVPLGGLEGYPPFEIRRNFADAANTDANFLGMASGKDQKDIYGSQQGPKWTEAMRKVYGSPEERGFYEKPLQKLASQYGLPYEREHPVGFDRPAMNKDPIQFAGDVNYEPDVVRAARGEGADGATPVTLGDYGLAKLQEAQAKLHAATADMPPETNLNERMRKAYRSGTDEGVSAHYAPSELKSHLGNLADNMFYDISNADGSGLLPEGMGSEATTIHHMARSELNRVASYGDSKTWPEADVFKEHLDKLEDMHKIAKAKIEEYNEAIKNPPKGAILKRPAVLMDAAARERIRRIGVPLFSAAGAALGINQMSNPDDQGFARGGAVRGFYSGGIASAGDRLTPEEIDQNSRPGPLRRMWPQMVADWSFLDKDGNPHVAGSDDSNRATNVKLLEDFGGSGAGMFGLGSKIYGAAAGLSDDDVKQGLEENNPISNATRWALDKSTDHYMKGNAIEEAVRKERGIPDAKYWWENAADIAGNVLGQLPTGELSLLSKLAKFKYLDKLTGASKMARTMKYLPPTVRNAIRPGAAVLDYFGPTIKGPLHPSSYAWATAAGLGIDKGVEMLQPDAKDDGSEEVAARTLDDARDKVHIHHLPGIRSHIRPMSFADGGIVAGGSSSLADGMSNLLEMAGRLGKLADKAYPTVSKHLKSPLSPKPKPKAKAS